jgi:hypothetical protein
MEGLTWVRVVAVPTDTADRLKSSVQQNFFETAGFVSRVMGIVCSGPERQIPAAAVTCSLSVQKTTN